MRVLHIISSSGLYGAERTLCNLFAHPADCEFSLAVFGSDSNAHAPFVEAAARAGARVVTLRAGLRASFAAVIRLLAHVRRERPHILHAHGYKGLAAGYIAAACLGLPLVYTQHGFILTSRKLRCYTRIDELLCARRRVSRVICVSEGIREAYLRAGVPEGKLVLLPNAVPLPARGAGQRRAARTGGPACLAVCRLSHEKGPDILLEAFALTARRRAGCTLLIAGDGPMRPTLEARIRELGLEGRVRLAGYATDVRGLMAAADIFVLPSLTEGTPMALLEAMGMELPVLCTSVGEVPRIVSPASGVLVPPGSATALARGLEQLLDAGPAARLGMGLAGREHVERCRAMANHVAALLRIYAGAFPQA